MSGVSRSCDRCKKHFDLDEKEIRTRDIGAYPGVPSTEGVEEYIKCPHCAYENPIRIVRISAHPQG